MSGHEIPDEGASSKGTMEGDDHYGPKLSDIKWLDLSRSVIQKKEKKILARALESNDLPNVQVLFLEGNAGDVGMMAMLNAIRAGNLKKLEKFILWEVSSYSQITTAEEGTDTIAAGLLAGNLPILHTMDLTGSLPKLIPARKLLTVVEELVFRCSCGTGRFWEGYQICLGCLFCNTHKEKNQALECLRCCCGRLQEYSGNDGIRKIAGALNKTPIESLRILILQHNYIGDKGASSLAKILRRGTLPNLDELDLRHNPVGYVGAKKIVFAYLRNPLLTVRVKLDWRSSMQEQQANAVRDSNIRLEHRLKKLNVPRDTIVVNQFIEFDYYLKTDPRPACFQKHIHTLHLLCQAHHAKRKHFKSHKVVMKGATDHKDREPKGIEIRSRSTFCSSTPKQNVQRDLESDTSDDEQATRGWELSADESDESDELPVEASLAPSEYSGHSSPGVGNLSPVRRHSPPPPPPPPKVVLDVLSSRRNSLFGRTPNYTPSTKRRMSVLKRTTGINRIYITSRSCGFIGAATALGKQLAGSASKRNRIAEYIDRNFRCIFWPWQSQRQTKRQMDSIKSELLMLGERKPDEFYGMFGLRQVLLRNADGERKNLYSRVWICDSCFEVYEKQKFEVDGKDLDVVLPITTDGELITSTPAASVRDSESSVASSVNRLSGEL
ncbi:unnamed protein product [Calypogeia fissa]